MWRVGVDVGGPFTDLFGWIDDYISVDHARDVYGVSVDKAARKINEAEPKALRGAT